MLFKEFLEEINIFDNGYKELSPVVSIVLPTYCRMKEGLLKKCVDSVLGQSYKNFELIIIDDGSSDGSQDLILRYAGYDKRIVYIRHEVNSGLPAVRTNEGIMHARGEYIAFAFDDNVWKEDFLKTLLEEMERNPADIQYSITKTVLNEEESINLGEWPLTIELLQHINTIANGSVLCRRSFFNDIGLYDPHICLRRICDWDLWLRAVKQGASFHYVNQELSVEYGPSSPVSLGQSVKMDYKIAYAYMVDEKRIHERSELLQPNKIQGYDVFDTTALLPYIIDYGEFAVYEELIIKPYFESHPDYFYDRKMTNRWFDNRTPDVISPFSGKHKFSKVKRILFVSNTYNEPLIELISKLSAGNDSTIILTCGEWQLSAFSAKDIDIVLLVDCSSKIILPMLMQFKKHDIPILYIVSYGIQKKPIPENAFDYNDLQHIRDAFGVDLYFPGKNLEWNRVFRENAERLISLSNIVINISDSENLNFTNATFRLQEDQPEFSLLSQINFISRMTSLKCLVFLNSELYAGSEVYGIMIARMLKKIGLEVIVCIPEKSTFNLKNGQNKLDDLVISYELPPLIRAPYKSGAPVNPVKNVTLIDWLQNENPGLIICSSVISDVLLASQHVNAKTVFALFQPTGYNATLIAQLKSICNAFISDSQWSSDRWNDAVNLDCIKVPSIVEDVSFKPFTGNDSGAIRIAIGGTLQPRKRQFEAIKACYLLIEQGYNIQLNVYGYMLSVLSDYIEDIENFVKDHKLTDRIAFHNLVDLDDIIKENDIILSASVDESLPQTMLLAMAGGMVAVACPSGGIEEIVINGETGYLANGFEVDDIKVAIEKSITQRNNWKNLVNNAQKLIREQYSLDFAYLKLIRYLSNKLNEEKFAVDNVQKNSNLFPHETEVPLDILRYSGHIRKMRKYKVRCKVDSFSRLGLIFATKNQNGNVSLNIYAGGRIIRRSTLSFSRVDSSSWTYFEFHPIRAAKGSIFIIELVFDGITKEVGVFEDVTRRNFFYKAMNKINIPLLGDDTLLVDFWEYK